MLFDCPFLICCLFYCLPWPSLLGMALYTATIHEKGGGRIQGREAKWLWGSIKRKAVRVKNYNQGTRGGHQTPPKSIHHFSKASKEPEDTAQQCEKQWEWKRPPEFLSYFLLLVVLTASLAKARRRACNLGSQTRARLIKSWWEQNNQNLITRVTENTRLDGPLSCSHQIASSPPCTTSSSLFNFSSFKWINNLSFKMLRLCNTWTSGTGWNELYGKLYMRFMRDLLLACMSTVRHELSKILCNSSTSSKETR